ncbi:MAG: hypothetical protein CMD18_00500 [Flavobacteriales bacterium]|nr:hypothetical protein [Flavobacteriales bacterium]
MSAFIGDIESEKDLIKTADKLFLAGKYADCLDYYSTLVSNHPQDPIFSYKYGVCKLYATEDKVESLRYLGFATKKKEKVDPIAFFFYGQALQQNYEFDAAAKQFKVYKSLVKPKEAEALNVSHYIKQCYTAKEKIFDFKKMDVVTKKSVGKEEFFRSYRLGSMKRNIIITPDEFLTSADKKSGDYSLIVHHPMNEVIYFSSYNKENSEGGKDIFKILKMPDGTFSDPVNLGPTVNTKMDEDYPYLHPNGVVLYFASKGRNGIGGYDIFVSNLDTATNIWGKAENVGFSINSPGDDLLYVSDMEENIAYFASDRGDKQGKITVYKIFPSKSNSPVIIVRGQVEIPGSRNHTAKITVYNSEGLELSTYMSQKSGTFVMTLDDAQTYTVSISASGRGEAKSELELPSISVANMVSKKFVLSGGKLILEEASELLATAESRSKLLKESAKLNINQSEDVDFNSKIDRPVSSVNLENDLTYSEIDPEGNKRDVEAYTESTILLDANQELEEVKQSKEQVKKQIDATYLVANKKKIKTELIKDEIEELSEELAMVFTADEKETLQKQLTQKETLLKANVASATTALQLAKSKERELVVKQKQEELAQIYVDAVKEANKSGNSSKAIAQLEKARDELDEVQEEIQRVKREDGSAETFAKADKARNKVADLQKKSAVLDQDFEDVTKQQEELKKQISATRNKGLKEEFNLQIKELDDELVDIKVERNVNQAKLEEAKSELAVYSSTQDVYEEVYAEADDPSLMPVSDNQKSVIEEEVVVQANIAKETLKDSDPDYEVPSVSVVKSDNSVKEEIAEVNTSDESGYVAEEVVVENRADDSEYIADEIALENTSDSEDTSGEVAVENISDESENIMDEVVVENSADEPESSIVDKNVSNEDQYIQAIAKAKNESVELNSLRDEISLLKASISNKAEGEDKKSLEDEMVGLRVKETELIDGIKEYVEIAKTKEEELPKEFSEQENNYLEQLEELNSFVGSIEKEIQEVKVQSNELEEAAPTKLITINPETATQEEIETLLANNFSISSVEISNNFEDDELNKWLEEVKELDKKSVDYLLAANKEQVNYENRGLEKDAPKALKLKAKALRKQFEKAELEGRVNQKRYTLLSENILKEMASLSSSETDDFKDNSADLKEKWDIIQVKRSQLNSEKDENNKIQLIKDVTELEQEVFDLQNKLKESIDSVKQEEDRLALQVAKEEEPFNKDDESDILDDSSTDEEVVLNTSGKENEVEITELEVESAEEEEESSDETAQEELSSTEVTLEEVAAEVKLVQASEEELKETVRSEVFTETVFYDKENPSKEAVKYGNKEGYGIIRKDDFTYTRSEEVIKSIEEAKALEKLALDYFFQAEAIKKEAEQNPEKADKLDKSVSKLMAKGVSIQDKANEKYRGLNQNELDFNREEVDFALEYNEIVKADSAKILLATADRLFEEAKEIRKEASKEKSVNKKGALINEAYNKELEAIEVQNYILSGELDGESSDIVEDVIVQTIKVKEENEYTIKADALAKAADQEMDWYKKRELFEEARAYELAGDKQRTKRLLNELKDEQVYFEKNSEIVVVSREQSHKNKVANQAWKYESQSDSLFNKAKVLREDAEKNENAVEKLEQIVTSNEIMDDAKVVQAKAIQKYQESRSVPDEDDFVTDFDKVSGGDIVAVKEASKGQEISLFAEIESARDSESRSSDNATNRNDGVVRSDEIVDASNESIEEDVLALDLDVSEDVSEKEEGNTPGEETSSENQLETTPVQKVTEVDVSEGNKSAEEAYKNLISEANEAEANEVNRVEEIFRLKDLAEVNRESSEKALSEVDGLNDEQAIAAKIAEADKFRKLAEEFEVEAKSQQMILKNNVAEARSKKKEADLILVGIDEARRADLMASVESDNSDLKRVQDYVATEVDINSSQEVVAVSDDNPIIPNQERVDQQISTQKTRETIDEKIDEVAFIEPDAPEVSEDFKKDEDLDFSSPELVEIDMNNVALMNTSGAVNDITEEFSLDSDKMYAPTTKIPVDPPMPKGLIYQVQVGAFRQKIDPGMFNGLSPLVGEQISSGITRYKVGYFRGFTSANIAKGRIRQLGYQDAFVVVFYNGKRITVEKAEEVITAADDSEQFVYRNLVKDEVEQLKSLGITSKQGDEFLATSSVPVVVDSQPDVSSSSKEVTPTEENGLSNDLLKINGLFYTVQVGVYKTPRQSSDLFGLSPLYTEKTSSGYLRYTTGMYQDYNSADQRKTAVRNQGVRDAFVTAYKNNQRISVAQAREEQNTPNGISSNSELTPDNIEVVFKVQVGAYRTPIVIERNPVFKELTNYKISSLKTSGGLLIYMVGAYKTKEEADNLRQVVVDFGGRDCFVVALVNGKRIPIARALEMVK